MGINELVTKLYEAKQAEQAAKNVRTALEAKLAQAIGVPDDWEGAKTNTVGEYKVTLTRKMNVKIDAVRLRELAIINNITPVLDTCFRWKPEIVKKEWDKADDGVRTKLAEALEITPGKASFTVKLMEEATA